MKPLPFGRYTLLKKIAAGGTADISLARLQGADGFARHLVIKRLHPHLSGEESFSQLILDEARLAAHLHHGHIIEIYEVGCEEGQPYIAMEYLPGPDLGRLLRDARRRKRRLLIWDPEEEEWSRIGLSAELLIAKDEAEALQHSSSGSIDLAILPASLPPESELIQSLQREHPELLRVLLRGPSQERCFGCLVAESQEELIKLVQASLKLSLPPELSLQILRAVADALHYAHSAQDFEGRPLEIIHRDINPSNLLLSVNGAIKLVDFGIARARSSVPRPGTLIGTYHYMSPEQASALPLDSRSDLFSFGTLLYTLLEGENPYRAESSFGTLRAIKEGPCPQLKAPGIPQRLRTLFLKTQSKAPEGRFSSTEELLAELEKILHMEGISLSPRRLARFMSVVYSSKELSAFGVQGTGHVNLNPEIEVDLEDLDAPLSEPPQWHPVESVESQPQSILWVLLLILSMVMLMGVWWF